METKSSRILDTFKPFYLIIIIILNAFLFLVRKRSVEYEWEDCGKDLGRVGRRKPVIRIHCEKMFI